MLTNYSLPWTRDRRVEGRFRSVIKAEALLNRLNGSVVADGVFCSKFCPRVARNSAS